MSVHGLPVEILARIFVQGAASDSNSPFLLRPHHKQPLSPHVPSLNFQILVSHVCHRWRSIALESAPLWTTLVFLEAPHIDRARSLLARVFPKGPLDTPNQKCHQLTHSAVPSSRNLTILISTVDQASHIEGVTIAKAEMHTIFCMLRQYLSAWRALHLVVRDNICKAVARDHLGNCGPGPSLETLQLYHFENFRAAEDLHLATYRPPVVVFANALPKLKNVSLIGVNLPWEKSPYLYDGRVKKLELALHADRVRPAYEWWERMLRGCGSKVLDVSSGKIEDKTQEEACTLEDLALHYSGPKVGDGEQRYLWQSVNDGRLSARNHWQRKIWMPRLERLSLTDLDPDYLCRILETLVLPAVKRLEFDLPEQDFTAFVNMLAEKEETAPETHTKEDSVPPPGSPASDSALSAHESLASSTAAPESAISFKAVSATPETDLIVSEPKALPLSGNQCNAQTKNTNNHVNGLVVKRLNADMRTFPALPLLEHLTISALECSEKSWRGFLSALKGLKVLEIDFERVNDGLWNVLIERADTVPVGKVAATTNPTLLPRLETFQISGLEGEKVAELVRWRSKPLACGKWAVKNWLVLWSERMRGKDKVLDEIVDKGVPITIQGRRVTTKITAYSGESFSGEYDDEYDDYDEDEEVDDIDEDEMDDELDEEEEDEDDE